MILRPRGGPSVPSLDAAHELAKGRRLWRAAEARMMLTPLVSLAHAVANNVPGHRCTPLERGPAGRATMQAFVTAVDSRGRSRSLL
jgi:hypothetical protein